MITLEDFLKRWPSRVDQTTKDEIQLFIDTVLERSDDYEALVSRLRASGRFKSILGDFGANAHRTTNMNYIPTILSSKERAAYPGDLYKTLLGIAQNGKRKSWARDCDFRLTRQTESEPRHRGRLNAHDAACSPRSSAHTEGAKRYHGYGRRLPGR
jgi:hypothetical protein